MKQKRKTLISVILFAVIFGALLITATFTDLQVSRILTRGTLPAGQYYADGIFGTVFETIGTAPEYFISVLCLEILMLYVLRFFQPGALRMILAIVAAVAAAGFYAAWLHEMFEYIFRHYMDDFPTFVWGVIAFITLIMMFFTTLAVDRLSDESLRRLPRFAFAALLGMLAATLIVQGLKIPFGRMRYRAMNTIGDFSYYTRWYVVNGQPDKTWMRELFGTSDACKSFPSGHTRGAAATFYLVLFAERLGVRNRKIIGALWAFALLFSALVAISRIMVGAHFFSDVLVGGTIGFLCCAAATKLSAGPAKEIKNKKEASHA